MMTVNEYQTLLSTLGGLLLALGYFLKLLHNDLRKTITDVSKIFGRLDVSEQITQLHLKQMADKIGELSDAVKESIQTHK